MNWFDRVLSGDPGFERDLVDRFSQRLIALARVQLPDHLRRRVDPEDVVQSVYRSFFRRLNEGQFSFEDSHDIWRLLAAITFRKSQNAVKFHQRQQRDARRDDTISDESPLPEPTPGPEDLVVFYDCLQRLLNELPENYQEMVVMRLESYSIEEIAEKVGRSQRTILRVLAHVRDMAAGELE